MSSVRPDTLRPDPGRAVFGAIDIGASGGRVAAGIVAGGTVSIEVLHRFENGATERNGHLRWDITAIYAEVLTGLRVLAERYPDVRSLGVDTWAVDYGRLDAAGELLADPIAYRDDRTADAVDARASAGPGGRALPDQRPAGVGVSTRSISSTSTVGPTTGARSNTCCCCRI